MIITLEQEESLVAEVNQFAESISLQENDLQRIISVHPEGNYLVTTGVYEFMGENYILSDYTDCGGEVQSLKSALKTEEAYYKTTTRDRNLAKNYDTASSFLSRSEYSEQIQNLVNEGYTLSFVTSQAYEAGSETVGIKGILKAEKSSNTRYFSVDIGIYVGNIGIETAKYTVAVEQAELKALNERLFLELTGDFAEYAKELESIQNAIK